MVKIFYSHIVLIFILGGCASKMKDQIAEYKKIYSLGDFTSAKVLLEKSELKKDKKSLLLWHLEQGTLAYDLKDFDQAISHFQTAIDLIDKLFTTKLSSKAASVLINDASDDFYGSSYERSYAYYFLSKAYYSKYLISNQKLDLQGARGAILSWDSYFAELERSGQKNLYYTDLMLKVFGGVIHEVSEVNHDKQISLQLYKDALQILDAQGGMFSVFNARNVDYIKKFKDENKRPSDEFYEKTARYQDLRKFLHFKILSLTKALRPYDLDKIKNELQVESSVVDQLQGTPTNAVFVIEEGVIPAKVGKTFNIGIRGAMNAVEDNSAKNFIATVGVEAITLFAMNTLGIVPHSPQDVGGFMFAHNLTKLAVAEAAIEFELPAIEESLPVKKTELVVMDEKDKIIHRASLPVINENGDLARIVLEEEIVSHYLKTGTRVAVKHLLAIITAMGVYQKFKGGTEGADFIAKSAALATYVAASKGLTLLEKADIRHWATLPQSIKMNELYLAPGKYKIALSEISQEKIESTDSKLLGEIEVKDSVKKIYSFRLP